jgi:hypothetical protein
MEFVKSLNQVQLRSLIPNQFSFEGQNHEENINLKTCQMKKDRNKKNRD